MEHLAKAGAKQKEFYLEVKLLQYKIILKNGMDNGMDCYTMKLLKVVICKIILVENWILTVYNFLWGPSAQMCLSSFRTRREGRKRATETQKQKVEFKEENKLNSTFPLDSTVQRNERKENVFFLEPESPPPPPLQKPTLSIRIWKGRKTKLRNFS